MSEKECVSREAAFNALLKLAPKVDEDGYCWVIRGDAAAAIDNIPAADVRPVVRGRWKKCVGENGVTSACRCSLCGFEDNRFSVFNYCPNCGACMREES